MAETRQPRTQRPHRHESKGHVADHVDPHRPRVREYEEDQLARVEHRGRRVAQERHPRTRLGRPERPAPGLPLLLDPPEQRVIEVPRIPERELAVSKQDVGEDGEQAARRGTPAPGRTPPSTAPGHHPCAENEPFCLHGGTTTTHRLSRRTQVLVLLGRPSVVEPTGGMTLDLGAGAARSAAGAASRDGQRQPADAQENAQKTASFAISTYSSTFTYWMTSAAAGPPEHAGPHYLLRRSHGQRRGDTNDQAGAGGTGGRPMLQGPGGRRATGARPAGSLRPQ